MSLLAVYEKSGVRALEVALEVLMHKKKVKRMLRRGYAVEEFEWNGPVAYLKEIAANSVGLAIFIVVVIVLVVGFKAVKGWIG